MRTFDICLMLIVFAAQSVMPLEIVSRKDWGAKAPKSVQRIHPHGGTVPYVIVHHSDSPACQTSQQCKSSMLSMQRFHQVERGWSDIGYTFAVGGDGKVYEGRGFNVVGAHAPNYNSKSIGILLIGDWNAAVPPQVMLQATKDLMAHAVEQGYLASDYTLYGHRQVRATACPGNALFNEIKQWPHFVERTN